MVAGGRWKEPGCRWQEAGSREQVPCAERWQLHHNLLAVQINQLISIQYVVYTLHDE